MSASATPYQLSLWAQPTVEDEPESIGDFDLNILASAMYESFCPDWREIEEDEFAPGAGEDGEDEWEEVDA